MKSYIRRYALVLSVFILMGLTGCGLTRSAAVKDQGEGLGYASSKTQPKATGPGMQYLDGHSEEDSADLVLPAEESQPEEGVSAPPTANGEDDSPAENSETVDNQALINSALDFYNASQHYWAENDPENALDALDQAYSYIVQVDTDDMPELIQQKEDLRFMISKRILEIYASRHTAVNGSHNAIPLTLNRYVEDEIKRFQGVERDFFISSYERSGMYRADILDALKEAGLPEELSWLPLIESGFKVNALSRARALGLWQFIPSTGYKYGLERDTWVDERLDPEKATAAAIAYLRELHAIFGDWTTVLAAYNCGEGTVLKRIRSQKINYLDDFWDLYEKLPAETARYVPRFLAVLHILNDPGRYGFDLDEKKTPPPYETVTIKKQMQLKEVAKKLECSSDDLRQLNPELRQLVTPATEYTLRVPPGKGEVLLAGLADIPEWSIPKSSYVYHRVRKGETLSLIAAKYHTSTSAIARANHIRVKQIIRVGQRLKIPVRHYASYDTPPKDGKYRVRKGDSLWVIAQKFNTSTKTLQEINGLRTVNLYVGQVLKVR